MSADGEFRFPPSLNPASFNELKYITLWELAGEPAVYEIFAEAHNIRADKPEQVAECVLRELYEEGYLAVIQRPWNVDGPGAPLAEREAHAVFAQLQTLEAWRHCDQGVWLAPTDKWWAWAEAEEGVKPPGEQLGSD